MSRISRALWKVCAPIALGVVLGAASLSAQVLLYVPAEGSSQLWEYGINLTTGAPFNYPVQPANGNQPNIVAVTPNNRFMYIGEGDGTIDAFVVNYDGTLTAVPPPFATAGGVRGLGIDPTGKFLYAADNPGSTIRVFSINQTTGALTALPAFTQVLAGGAQPRGIAIDGSGHLYVALAGLNQVGQFNINTTTGQLTSIAAPIAAGVTPDRVAVAPSGFVYVSNFFDHTLSIYSIGGGGALSAVGAPVSTGSPSRPLGVTVHNNGNFLIVSLNSNAIVDNVLVYRINGNGTLTQVSSGQTTGATGALASGIAVDPTGQYVYVANAGNATVTKFNFNATTGALSAPLNFATGTNPGFLLSRPAPATPGVPTLSTWSLVLLGMLLAGSSALMYRRAYR